MGGLDSGAEIIGPGPTAMRTVDGRLWFTRRDSVWWIDPNKIPHNAVPPIVSVEDVVCNGIRYPAGSDVTLPPRSRNLEIDYVAVSLTQPERIRIRYRLAGVDEGWQEAGQRRQAYYTNLGPGAHEFEVMAANEDGVWSTGTAVLRLNLRPAYYQTLGFKIAAGLAAVLVLAALFFARLEQLHRRYRREVEARHAERERIARDLHDTLLQGVQALLFRLRIWEEEPRIPEPIRDELAAVSRQTQSIALEGRERILTMRRTDAQPADLAESLAAIGSEVSTEPMPAFAVNVTGDPRMLIVDAKEQLLEIAREAVRNAMKHARPSRVTVTLEYRRRSLAMTIADDGRGFEAAGAEGRAVQSKHFGLAGMRERARQLSAQFRVQSDPASGTRIEIIAPAWAAFRDAFRWPWRLGRAG
jgi:signal transduction histidine kinase